MRTLALLLCAAALPAAAQDAMTAAEFDAYVTGKVLTYSAGGPPYGVEEYQENRRVAWRLGEDECQYGIWYPKGTEEICFLYEGDPDEKCWIFFERAEGLEARYTSDASNFTLYEIEVGDRLICPGPRVGV